MDIQSDLDNYSKDFKAMPSIDLIQTFEKAILESNILLKRKATSELLDRCAYAMANRGD